MTAYRPAAGPTPRAYPTSDAAVGSNRPARRHGMPMRWRLTLGAGAIAVTVIVAFIVPLAIAVRLLAADHAVQAAQSEAQSLAGVLASVPDPVTLRRVVEQAEARDNIPVTVFLADGTVIGDQTPGGPPLALAQRGRAFVASVEGGRAAFVPVVNSAGVVSVVRAVASTAALHRGVARAWLFLAGLAVALIAIAAAFADRLALSIVKPIAGLARVAHRLEGGDLDARWAPTGPPEVATVGHALNLLAERIHHLLAAEREAAADLSHRLRTPLTVLRLEVEASATGEARGRLTATVDELEDAVTQVIHEARRAGPKPETQECNMARVTRERMAFWSALAEAQGRPWSLAVADDDVPIATSADQFTGALDALLANVLAYTPEGTGFRVEVARTEDGGGLLIVEDDGPGWPAGMRLKRGVSSTGSTGLGLDIVRRTAQRTGGECRLRRAEAGGARVELVFGPGGRRRRS